MAGLLNAKLPDPQAAPLLPGRVALPPGLLSADRTASLYSDPTVGNPAVITPTAKIGTDISTEYDPNTGAPSDPMAYQGSLLDTTTQGAISKQAGQGSYAGIGEGGPGAGLLQTGTRDFAGERSQDLKGVPGISQYSRGMTSPEDVNSAIGAGYAQRNSEHMADLERKITREEPIYRAKAQARAAKNLIASEQVRFKNWTLRQQQKLQALQLQQQLDGAKDQLVGTIVGGAGAAVGFVAGGPAGGAAGAAGGSALGKAVA